MSFFSTLGQKISGTAHRVGSKVMGAVHKGEKFVAVRLSGRYLFGTSLVSPL